MRIIGTLILFLCVVVAVVSIGCAGAGAETRTALEEQRDVYYDANSFSMKDRTTQAGETVYIENLTSGDPNVCLTMTTSEGVSTITGGATVVYRKHDPDAAAKAFTKAFTEREETNRQALASVERAYKRTVDAVAARYGASGSSVASATNTPATSGTDCSDGDCALQALGQTFKARLDAMGNDDKRAILDMIGLGRLAPLFGLPTKAESVGPDAPED
jgi:hypothetical protein